MKIIPHYASLHFIMASQIEFAFEHAWFKHLKMLVTQSFQKKNSTLQLITSFKNHNHITKQKNSSQNIT